jgi:hypothetical protein
VLRLHLVFSGKKMRFNKPYLHTFIFHSCSTQNVNMSVMFHIQMIHFSAKLKFQMYQIFLPADSFRAIKF